MLNEIAMLIALMCPQPTLKAKVKCVGSIRACLEDSSVKVAKGNHKVFKCAKVVADRDTKAKTAKAKKK